MAPPWCRRRHRRPHRRGAGAASPARKAAPRRDQRHCPAAGGRPAQPGAVRAGQRADGSFRRSAGSPPVAQAVAARRWAGQDEPMRREQAAAGPADGAAKCHPQGLAPRRAGRALRVQGETRRPAAAGPARQRALRPARPTPQKSASGPRQSGGAGRRTCRIFLYLAGRGGRRYPRLRRDDNCFALI